MSVRIVTVKFDPMKELFDDRDLQQVLLSKQVMELQPQFFTQYGEAYWRENHPALRVYALQGALLLGKEGSYLALCKRCYKISEKNYSDSPPAKYP